MCIHKVILYVPTHIFWTCKSVCLYCVGTPLGIQTSIIYFRFPRNKIHLVATLHPVYLFSFMLNIKSIYCNVSMKVNWPLMEEERLLNQTSTQTIIIHVHVMRWELIILIGITNEIKPRSRLYYKNRKSLESLFFKDLNILQDHYGIFLSKNILYWKSWKTQKPK